MKTMRLLLLSAFILIGLKVFGQNVRDYFYNGAYPSQNDPLVATIDESNEKGKAMEVNEMIDELSVLQTTKRVFVPASWEYAAKWVTTSETKYNLLYTKDIIYTTAQITKSLIDITGNKTSWFQSSSDIKKILLALPLENGRRKWIEDNGDGDKYSCSAEWAYIVGEHDFCEKVIKMTKKYEFWGGMIEYSYWAPNLGKVWETLEMADDGVKTIGRREEFSSFREISEDEYIKKTTLSEFIRTRADSIRSFRKDNPQTYSLLEDAFAKYVLTLNHKELVYVAGDVSKDKWNYWLSNEEWPNFQIKYTMTLSVNDLGVTCNGMSNNYQGETKYYFYNQRLPEDCAKYAFENVPNNVIEPSFEIEPTTNYKYHFNMVDNFRETIDINSYVFKIKKKKGNFIMVSGDVDVWNHCQIHAMNNELEKISQNKGKNTFNCRILKFTCGKYIRYSLVTDASIYQYRQAYICCKLFNIDK